MNDRGIKLAQAREYLADAVRKQKAAASMLRELRDTAPPGSLERVLMRRATNELDVASEAMTQIKVLLAIK